MTIYVLVQLAQVKGITTDSNVVQAWLHSTSDNGYYATAEYGDVSGLAEFWDDGDQQDSL